MMCVYRRVCVSENIGRVNMCNMSSVCVCLCRSVYMSISSIVSIAEHVYTHICVHGDGPEMDVCTDQML